MAESSSLGQIKNKSLRERVLDSLRTAIVSGELKPGQPLVETELAAQLGVSRAPLREAIHILNTEGLLETVPYHGTTVRRLNRTDIEELYSLRSLLESFAIERIIVNGEPESAVNVLRGITNEMLSAAEDGDLSAVNRLDRRFHDALIELSGHSLLATLWNTITQRVQQVMALRNRRNSDMRQIAYNHLPIIEAIEQQDAELAMSLIRKHVATAGDLIAELWEDAPNND